MLQLACEHTSMSAKYGLLSPASNA